MRRKRRRAKPSWTLIIVALVVGSFCALVSRYPLYASILGIASAYASFFVVRSASTLAKHNGETNWSGITLAALVSAVCLPLPLALPFLGYLRGWKTLSKTETAFQSAMGIAALFAWLRFRSRQKDLFIRPEWNDNPDLFYSSKQWQRMRARVIRHYGRECAKCKKTPATAQGFTFFPRTTDPLSFEFHVDHIKPRSHYPELALTFSNLQVLCRACNLTKGNLHETDYRS